MVKVEGQVRVAVAGGAGVEAAQSPASGAVALASPLVSPPIVSSRQEVKVTGLARGALRGRPGRGLRRRSLLGP